MEQSGCSWSSKARNDQARENCGELCRKADDAHGSIQERLWQRVFLTNVYLDDELNDVSTALLRGDLDNHILKAFMAHFNAAFVDGDPLDDDTIKTKLSKLRLDAGNSYLHPHSEEFDALARDAIFKYSEVDLRHTESRRSLRILSRWWT